jgi:hypothetical protein
MSEWQDAIIPILNFQSEFDNNKLLPSKLIYALLGIMHPMLDYFHCDSYPKALLSVSPSEVLKVVPYSSAMKNRSVESYALNNYFV